MTRAAQLDAVLHALAAGDHAAADAVAALTPEELAAVLAGEDEPVSKAFNEADHPRADDGRFGPGGGGAAAGPAPHPADGVDLSGVAASPEAKADPGLLARVRDAVGKGVDLARRAAYEVALKSPQIIAAWTGVFDHPDDLKKIGYNPSFSGVDGPGAADAVRDATGVPAHMAMNLLAKAVPAVIAQVKRRLGVVKAMAEYDPHAVAEFLHAILTHLAAELGLPAPPPAETIAAHLAGGGGVNAVRS